MIPSKVPSPIPRTKDNNSNSHFLTPLIKSANQSQILSNPKHSP